MFSQNKQTLAKKIILSRNCFPDLQNRKNALFSSLLLLRQACRLGHIQTLRFPIWYADIFKAALMRYPEEVTEITFGY